jgi:two-component system, sensor histidine kinase RegB
MAFDLEPSITRPWLVRLRWLFFAGQALVLAISRLTGADPGHHRDVLIAAVAAYGLSNLALLRAPARARLAPARLMGAVLILDGVLLTVMLAASGGSSNPFSVLYLVHITLAALVLGSRWTFAISALCILEYGLLFSMPQAQHHHGGAGFDQHLYGMFAAFVLAAALIAFFVGKIARAIAAQREQIAALREDAARNARLASITTLAAGAAHELGSPLATIAVAAHEASLRLGGPAAGAPAAASGPPVSPIAADLRLILLEVDRCQDILSQLAARSAQADDPRPVSLDELADELREISRDLHGEAAAGRLEISAGDARPSLRVPVEQLAQSLAALVKNALDASPPGERVQVRLERQAQVVRIAIEDRGAGIDPERLPHVGEPFFTTKEPGRGLGLGVFLARAFFESQGGTLRIESAPGRGTKVVGTLPVLVAASEVG